MNLKYYFLFLLVFLCVDSRVALAQELIAVRASQQDEVITLNAPHGGRHKVFTLSSPDRLVVDVPSLKNRPEVRLPRSYKGTLIKQARFAQFNPETSRFVFDLEKPVRLSAVNDERSDALIISITPDSGGKIADKPTTQPQKKPAKPVVVIDAGHGGQDPGAIGPKGTREKDVVLEYAKVLKAKLDKTGRYKVVLTRSDDRYIMLRERVNIARRAGGNVFISMHADTAPDKGARGLSVYTVSEQASDEEAEALAARENKSDVIAGMDLSTEREDVAGILISLAQRETKNNSATLADLLVIALDEKVKLLQNTHRFAGFAVLKAPDIPSVLIEIGFLSNPAEEKLLKSKSYRDKVAAGIVAGLDMYFEQMSEGGLP